MYQWHSCDSRRPLYQILEVRKPKQPFGKNVVIILSSIHIYQGTKPPVVVPNYNPSILIIAARADQISSSSSSSCCCCCCCCCCCRVCLFVYLFVGWICPFVFFLLENLSIIVLTFVWNTGPSWRPGVYAQLHLAIEAFGCMAVFENMLSVVNELCCG